MPDIRHQAEYYAVRLYAVAYIIRAVMRNGEGGYIQIPYLYPDIFLNNLCVC